MKPHALTESVTALPVADWGRRLFDALIPIPDGTSYNSYLVRGSDKTLLIDTADPSKREAFEPLLETAPRIDHVVSLHAEQDHSGLLSLVLERHPAATLLTSAKAKPMLIDLLGLPADRITTVADGETIALGGRTLEFLHTPWVHWPETMCAYLREDKVLFSCDLFGSHLAASTPELDDDARLYEAAKRYFATIMMPFGKFIDRHLKRLADYDIALIAPSHGPVYRRPESIMAAYRRWVSGPLADRVVIAYETMHFSTEAVVQQLAGALGAHGIAVDLFPLGNADLGRLAMALVDATTVVLGTPVVAGGPHPSVFHAAYVASILKPRTKFLSVVGSAGWSPAKTVKMLADVLAPVPAEPLEGVFASGMPKQADRQAIESLAATIAEKHVAAGVRAARPS